MNIIWRNHMAVDTLRRYIWLIDTINRLEYIEFKDIQKEWLHSGLNHYNEEFPLRTFRNHINAISDQFGIDIEYRKGWGYHISNPEDLNESKMTQWLVSTLSTYNTLAECKGMKDSILFENVPSSQKYLSFIIHAMKDGLSIAFMYQSFFSAEPHIVEAEPYCFKLFKQRWYLLARSKEVDELRIYALDRMDDVDVTNHKYTIPEDFDGASYFRNYYGIKAAEKPERIKLKAIPLEAKYIRSLPIHHSQKEVETTDTYSIFEMYLSPEWDFKQELLSRADQIEVLEPASLRDWMKEMTKKMFEKYSNSK